MEKKSPFDIAAFQGPGWERYKRLMRWMFGVTVVVVVFALTLMYREVGMVSVHFFIATGLGIAFSMLLMSGLMGLVFLSSATGHDEGLDDRKSDGGAAEKPADAPADQDDQG